MHRAEVYRTLLREYQELVLDNRQQLERRKELVFVTHPALRDLVQSKTQLMFRVPDMSLTEGERRAFIQDVQEKLRAVDREIRRQLQGLGYSADFFDPIYRCKRCKDTGYLLDGTQSTYCICLRQRAAQRMGLANLMEEVPPLSKLDFSVYPEALSEGSKLTQREYMRRLHAELMEYMQAFPENAKRNILVYGPTGVGKSFLLQCLTREAMDRGYVAYYMTAYQLFETMLQSFTAKGVAADEAMQDLLEVDLLLVDDLGSEPLRNNFTLEYLFVLLNERLLAGKHTVIATNLNISRIQDRYGERVSSRLSDSATTRRFHVRGQDVRMQ